MTEENRIRRAVAPPQKPKETQEARVHRLAEKHNYCVSKSENGRFTMVARDQLDVVIDGNLDAIDDFLRELEIEVREFEIAEAKYVEERLRIRFAAQVDHLVDLLANNPICGYIPRKVTRNIKLGLYQFLEKHSREQIDVVNVEYADFA
jgi:hypothetical protein